MAIVSDADLQAMPKVELHVHLGGTIAESTARILAAGHGVPEADLPFVDGRYPGRYRDFGGFLDAFLGANALVRTAEDLHLVAATFARGQAEQGIVYSETIFTPMIYVRNGMPADVMWEAVRTGLAEGGDGARIGIVADVIRDFGWPEAKATIDLVEAADAPIVGLGLTGVEGTVPTEDFRGLREATRSMGLGFEVHAGEMGPPSSVVATLDILEADRIGHGVASIRDPELVGRLVREGVVLDVCPTSNVAIGEYPSIAAHPFTPLRGAGVRMTISSDDPPFFATTLANELRGVADAAGLTRDDVVDLQREAARAAFLPAADRADLLARIDAWAAATP